MTVYLVIWGDGYELHSVEKVFKEYAAAQAWIDTFPESQRKWYGIHIFEVE